MHLPIIAAHAIMYTVYAAKLYTAQTNAITNNAAGARLYLTHIVATGNSCSIDIAAVPSNCSSKADAKARQYNAHGNVSVSVN